MIEALKVIRQSLKDLWEEFVVLITLNVVWSLTVLLAIIPLILWGSRSPVAALGLSLLLSIPVAVVSAGLCLVTNQIAQGKAIGWSTFVTGLRRYWLKSLAVALINLVALSLIGMNVRFYASVLTGTWTNLAVAAWLIGGLYWLIAQIYWFPLILELEGEKVLLALRNALALVIVSPGFSLSVAALLALLTALCIVLTVPMILFMAALLLLAINHATRNRLDFVRQKRESRESEK